VSLPKNFSLGLKDYLPIWEHQQNWMEKSLQLRKANKSIQEEVLFVEHPHVYTLGKSANKNHLLVNSQFLASIHATSYQIERGGDITYHGPGQLVVYPLLDLENYKMGAKSYIYNLEQVIIDVLQEYRVIGERIPSKTGIWIDKGQSNERKIAAIGIKCSRHLAMHGLAFNVNTNLEYFNHIVPCGLAGSKVTSLNKELGKEIPMETIIQHFKHHFNHYFKN
jgi:lipoyl(octanoyl) transferase